MAGRWLISVDKLRRLLTNRGHKNAHSRMAGCTAPSPCAPHRTPETRLIIRLLSADANARFRLAPGPT